MGRKESNQTNKIYYIQLVDYFAHILYLSNTHNYMACD